MISGEEFLSQLRSLCDAYGLREFAIYGRFAQTVASNGMLLPADRFALLEGESMVVEEAAYYLGRIADGLPPL